MFIPYKAVINVSEKRTSAGKKAVDSNETGGSGQAVGVNSSYTGYFYNQIDRLWAEIMHLQEQNNELRASIKGGP